MVIERQGRGAPGAVRGRAHWREEEVRRVQLLYHKKMSPCFNFLVLYNNKFILIIIVNVVKVKVIVIVIVT